MEGGRCLLGTYILCTILCTKQVYSTSGFYGDNGMQQTQRLGPIPSRQRREIKQEILTLLGLHHKPKSFLPVEESSAPRYMLDLYNTITLQNGGEVQSDIGSMRYNDEQSMMNINMSMLHAQEVIKQADMVMSFINYATKKNGFTKDRHKRYYFDFSDVPPTENVLAAQLRVYKRESKKRAGQDPFKLELFRMDRGKKDGDDETMLSLTSTSVVREEDGWLSFNVTSAAAYWTSFPASNRGFYMQITDSNGKEMEPHEIGMVGRRGPDDKQPFLVTYFRNRQQINVRKVRDAHKKRQKEQAQSTEAMYNDDNGYFPQPKRRVCQRRTLFVNFKDLGWQEWIIAPKGYAAYFCSGECSFPLNAHMNATNHAIVQTLVHLMNPNKIPLPCCAPTNLSAISVLYFDDGSNVVLKKFNDIVVRACGCH